MSIEVGFHTAVSRRCQTAPVGPDLQDIVDEVSRVLATPVVLEDRDFNLVVFAAHADEVDPVRQRTILQRRSSAEVQDWFEAFGIASSDRPVRTPADPARGIVARACLPARWNGVTYGYLWALDEHHRLDDALLERVMRHAAPRRDRHGAACPHPAEPRRPGARPAHRRPGRRRGRRRGDRRARRPRPGRAGGRGGARPRCSWGPAATQPLAAAARGRRRRHRHGRGPARPGRAGRPRCRPQRPAARHRTPARRRCTTPWSRASGPPARTSR